jgi:hypothetical protein
MSFRCLGSTLDAREDEVGSQVSGVAILEEEKYSHENNDLSDQLDQLESQF